MIVRATAVVVTVMLTVALPSVSAHQQPGPFSVNHSNDIRAIALQADGKILVVEARKIARLNADGSIDPTFVAWREQQ